MYNEPNNSGFWSYQAANNSNANRLKRDNQCFKILNHLINNGPSTKYQLLTLALNKTGTKKSLRGYYSLYFQSLVHHDIISIKRCENDRRSFRYSITQIGRDKMSKVK